MKPQVDTCWVHYAGYDPAEYILKYKDRVDVVHLKDFTCKNLAGGPAYALIDGDGKPIEKPSREDNEFKFMPLGMGRQDFKAILEAADKASTQTVFVVQYQSLDTPPMEAAAISLKYLLDTFGF